MKFDTFKFYSFAGSYFANNDASGLSQEEKILADRYLALLRKSYGNFTVEDVQEYGFGTPDIANWDKGDLAEYTISYTTK
jgi:hypothetical protein